jgi:hypothetical protein
VGEELTLAVEKGRESSNADGCLGSASELRVNRFELDTRIGCLRKDRIPRYSGSGKSTGFPAHGLSVSFKGSIGELCHLCSLVQAGQHLLDQALFCCQLRADRSHRYARTAEHVPTRQKEHVKI